MDNQDTGSSDSFQGKKFFTRIIFLVDPTHAEKYRKKMNSYEQVHLRRNPIVAGDRVVIKLDYDNNPATRRKTFATFYEQKIYVVVEVLNSNHLRLKCEHEERIIYKGRVKKLK